MTMRMHGGWAHLSKHWLPDKTASAMRALAPAPSTDLLRPLLQIQHQNEINDAFFLADALTKRWLMCLGQPAVALWAAWWPLLPVCWTLSMTVAPCSAWRSCLHGHLCCPAVQWKW